MSQETYIKDQEEEIFVQGGRFYHSEAAARRYRQSHSVWSDPEYKGQPGRERFLGHKTCPIYRVKLTWELIEPEVFAPKDES